MNSQQDNLSLKKKNKAVSSFILKAYELLMEEQNWRIVRWSHNGIGFVVLNEDQFAKLILPKYFKHSNYSSFVRQLNMYNFHKIREHNGESYFHHQHFVKNDNNSLAQIKRKPEKKKRKIIDGEEDDSAFSEPQSHFQQESSGKKNPQHQIETPSSFTKEQSQKMIEQEEECVESKSKLTIQASDKIFESARRIFPSQFTLKLENLPFGSTSTKKINEDFFEGQQENDDKISINDEIQERDDIELIRFPTREFMNPSKNNILPLGNIKDSQSFDIFF